MHFLVINTSNWFLNGIKLHNSVTPWNWLWNISNLICFLPLNAKIIKKKLPFLSIFHAKWLLVPAKKITSLILYIACWMYFSHWRKMQTKNTMKRRQSITDVSKEGWFYSKWLFHDHFFALSKLKSCLKNIQLQ